MTRHPHLRLVDGRYGQHVTLPRTVVVEAAMNAKALADDLEAVLAAIEQRTWANSRAGVINEVGRGRHRIGELRGAFLELAGIAESGTPSDPADAARARAA